MTTTDIRPTSPRVAATVSLWSNRGIELLWLLTVLLVPLVYLDRDFVRSEAVIAYVEVPKIALLRTLVGLMAVLWLIEWSVQGQWPLRFMDWRDNSWRRPKYWWAAIAAWLRGRPTRWVLFAVWFFLGTTLLSTVLSASFSVSLWGEVPGQDGYAAYTMLAYILLFAVVSTHLKTKAQLWRLMGAIVIMGTLVSVYSIAQHYGHDPLNLTEQTGGGKGRVTSVMGNAIFAAAVMFMTIPISLVAGTISIREPTGAPALGKKLANWALALGWTILWALILSIQLLGITFTFSRGPWVGTIVAVAAFLGLTALFVNRRSLGRTWLLIGLTFVLTLALLQALGSIFVLGVGAWLSAIFAAIGIAGLVGVFALQSRLLQILASVRQSWALQAAAGLLAAAVVVAVLVIVPAWNKTDEVDEELPESDAGLVSTRLASIRSEVVTGGLGGRTEYWEGSWRLIRDHPWFDFDTLSISWLRPIIGYGPDLFRYTYLQESPPTSRGLFPEEPDHAHNFFINQTVEQGYLGLLSSLGIFLAVFLAGAYTLLRYKRGVSNIHKLVLLALLAIFVGRFLEQMVGLARVSDLTLFWVLLGVFVALPGLMASPEAAEDETQPVPQPNMPQRRSGRRGAVAQTRGTNWALIGRLAVVAWLLGGVFVLTWVKNVNYVRAAHLVSNAKESLQEGDRQGTLLALDRAIELAPDVSLYNNHRANVYLSYLTNPFGAPEQKCDTQDQIPYRLCLATNSLQSNIDGAASRPFYYRSRLALANSFFQFGQSDQAIQHYRDSLSLVPNSWPIRNGLADAFLAAEQPEEALDVLEDSLAITGSDFRSADALFLKGLALQELGDHEGSVRSLERSLELGLSVDREESARLLISSPFAERAQSYFEMGDYGLAIQEWDRAIEVFPQNAPFYLNRGLAYFELGDPEQAARSYDESLQIDPLNANAYYNLGNAQKERGPNEYQSALDAYDEAIRLDPRRAEAYVGRGAVLTELGQLEKAIEDLNEAIRLNSRSTNIYIYRSQAFRGTGQLNPAIEDLSQVLLSDPQNIAAYLDRAAAYQELGEQERAIEDYNSALGLGADDSLIYNNRGTSYGELGLHDLAIADFDQAIGFDPEFGLAYNNRGNSYGALSQHEQAIQNYDAAISLSTDFAVAYSNRGNSYSALGAYFEAIEDYDEAIRLNPSLTEAYNNRGQAYSQIGRQQRAIKDFDTAIGLDAGIAQSYANRGRSLAAQGEHLLAIYDFQEAILLDPGQEEIVGISSMLGLVQAGYTVVNADETELEQAIGQLQDTISRERDFALVSAFVHTIGQSLALRGEDLFAEGQHQRAAKIFDLAIIIDPEDPQLYYLRGKTLVAAGAPEQAIDDYNEAIRLGSATSLPPALDASAKALAELYADRGEEHVRQGLHELALEAYNLALEFDPTDPVICNDRRQLLDDLGLELEEDSASTTAQGVDVTGLGLAGGTFTFSRGGAGDNSSLYDNTVVPGASPVGHTLASFTSYDFGCAKEFHIRRVIIKNYSNEGITFRATWKLEYSDDGKLWSEVGELIMQSGQGNTHSHDFPVSGDHRYWRLHAKRIANEDGSGAGSLWIEEVEMFE